MNKLALPLAAVLLAGCAQMPSGPTVQVMPSPYKPFDVFAQEDQLCRDWAARAAGQPGHDEAADAFLRSTATGATVGALAGAVAAGNHGAGEGAAVGTVLGAAVGAQESANAAWTAQRRYDIAYAQCMVAKGNVMPGMVQRPPPPPSLPPAPVH